MSTTKHTRTTSEDKLGALKGVLYLLQTNLEEFKDEVDSSYELLKIGEKTDLSKKLESIIDSPIDGFFELSKDVNNKALYLVDAMVKASFQENAKLIASAYRSKQYEHELHYSIVLDNDNLDNRMQVKEFLGLLEAWDVSPQYPVYFQFIEKTLIAKVNHLQPIDIAK